MWFDIMLTIAANLYVDAVLGPLNAIGVGGLDYVYTYRDGLVFLLSGDAARAFLGLANFGVLGTGLLAWGGVFAAALAIKAVRWLVGLFTGASS